MFSLFSDRAQRAHVRLLDRDGSERKRVLLEERGDGVRAAFVPEIGAGTLYDFLLDDERVPDPFARFLPQGVHGPAEVVSSEHDWQHGLGVSRPLREQIFYELHIGTFTPEGTYDAARERLPLLRELGVTTLQLMPIAAYAGRWGWGYDGVALFAPHAPYGTPTALRRFIDAAHGLGLGVVLDVVYNHFGPAGNYLTKYSASYMHANGEGLWGDQPDFGRPAMRRLVRENVGYWLTEFRFDGLRLDATHAIHDTSPRHILKEITALAHGLQPRKLVIAEDDRNEAALVTSQGLDGLWADDFHHVAHVTVTGERDGYYACYEPGAASLATTLEGGWLYRGQTYPTSGKPRGTNAKDLGAESFVYALQNHDQVGNRPFGDRLSHLVGPERAAGLAALLLFLPMTPLLFMGEEWAASTPFLYFTDHEPELGRLITAGRRREFASFRGFAEEGERAIPDPQAPQTFEQSRLAWNERDDGPHARMLALYQRLLRLRSTDPVLRRAQRGDLEVRAEGEALVCRLRHEGDVRTLVLNLGPTPLSLESPALRPAALDVLLRTDDEERPPVGAEPGRRLAPLAPFAALIARESSREAG